jgi:hypothetical protein
MVSWACYRMVSEKFFVVAHLSEYLGISNIGIKAFGSTMDLYGMKTSAILTNSLLQSISLYQIWENGKIQSENSQILGEICMLFGNGMSN